MDQIVPKDDFETMYHKLIDNKYSYSNIIIYFFLKHYINITTFDFYKKKLNKIENIYDQLVKQKYSPKYIIGYILVKHNINITSLKFFTS